MEYSCFDEDTQEIRNSIGSPSSLNQTLRVNQTKRFEEKNVQKDFIYISENKSDVSFNDFQDFSEFTDLESSISNIPNVTFPDSLEIVKVMNSKLRKNSQQEILKLRESIQKVSEIIKRENNHKKVKNPIIFQKNMEKNKKINNKKEKKLMISHEIQHIKTQLSKIQSLESEINKHSLDESSNFCEIPQKVVCKLEKTEEDHSCNLTCCSFFSRLFFNN